MTKKREYQEADAQVKSARSASTPISIGMQCFGFVGDGDHSFVWVGVSI